MSNALDPQFFLRTAEMELSEGRIVVRIVNDQNAAVDNVVYAWTTPERLPLRFGTSKGPSRGRLLSYRTYINKRLDGGKSVTPEWEANLWVATLEQHGRLIGLVHRPELVQTVAGPIRPFLDVERELIRRFRPSLNRSHR